MPWYKVPLSVYLQAAGPCEAQEAALALVPASDGPLSTARYPDELTPGQLESHRRLRAIVDRARADSEAGLTVTDSRYPGVRFTPEAAAALAALEFEEL